MLEPNRAKETRVAWEVEGLLIQIDLARERFLADHVVGGTPLLPTAMALDLVVRVAGVTKAPATAVVVRGLEVGAPILVTGGSSLVLRLTVGEPATSGGRVCIIRSADTDVTHYQAVVGTRRMLMRETLPDTASPTNLPVRPNHVYPPFFHGPTFQVIGGMGRIGRGFVASMAGDLPTLGWSSGGLQIRPRLLELFMQTCGVAAFAATGRMMIPSRIDRMTWCPPALRPVDDAAEGVTAAHVLARVSSALDGPNIYDGVVVAANGQVLLTVEGYRPVDLGVPPDVAHASVLRARLDYDLSEAMSTTAVQPQPQGVRP